MISEACSILMCLKCLKKKSPSKPACHSTKLLGYKILIVTCIPEVLQIPCEQVLRNPKPTSKRDSFRFLFISYLENRGTNEENKNHPTEQKEGGIFFGGGGRDSRKLSNLVGEIWGEVIFKCHVYLKWPSCIQNSLQHHVNVSHQNNPLTLLPIILVV